MTFSQDHSDTDIDLSPVRSGLMSGPFARVAKLALFVLVMFFVVRSIVGRLGDVPWSSFHVDKRYVLLAVMSQLLSMVIWAATPHVLLAGMCDRPKLRVTLGVLWIARLGKYIPGKMASVLGATWMFHQRGVPASAALNAILLHQGLWLVLGLMTAVPLTLWQPVRDALPMAWLWCVGLVAAGAVCLHPVVLLGVGNAILRKLRLQPLKASHDLRRYLFPLVMLTVNISLGGFTLWALSRSVTEVSGWLGPMFIAAASLGATIGFLAIFTPGGLGVREGILLIVLSPLVGAANSAVIIVGSRLLQTFGELIMAGIGMLLLWRSDRERQQ